MARFEDNSAKFYEQLDQRVFRFLRDAGTIVLRKAKENCRRRSGELARSIFMVIEGRICRVGTNLDYGPMIELGTKPHTIRPNTKFALYWKGANHPVKKVEHPGMKSFPYLRPALETSKSEINQIAKRERLE